MTSQEIFWGTWYFNFSENVLCSVSHYFKVQVPHWTPFCYMVMNKHNKNCKPIILFYVFDDILWMYTLNSCKKAQTHNNHRNQKKCKDGSGKLNKAIITAPSYIILRNHPYISSCKPDLLRYLLQLLMQGWLCRTM